MGCIWPSQEAICPSLGGPFAHHSQEAICPSQKTHLHFFGGPFAPMGGPFDPFAPPFEERIWDIWASGRAICTHLHTLFGEEKCIWAYGPPILHRGGRAICPRPVVTAYTLARGLSDTNNSTQTQTGTTEYSFSLGKCCIPWSLFELS